MLNPDDEMFEYWMESLERTLRENCLPPGSLTTEATAAAALEIPAEQINAVLRVLSGGRRVLDTPVHRIVGEGGFLPMLYADRSLERLIAEGWEVRRDERRERVVGFEDAWHSRLTWGASPPSPAALGGPAAALTFDYSRQQAKAQAIRAEYQPVAEVIAFLLDSSWLPPGRLTTTRTVSSLLKISPGRLYDALRMLQRLCGESAGVQLGAHRILASGGGIDRHVPQNRYREALEADGHLVIAGILDGYRVAGFVDALADVPLTLPD